MNINNPKIWTITDGSQGMISQVKGLAFELSNEITEIKTDIIFPWNSIQPGFLPNFKWIFKNEIPNYIPDIIISCGRKKCLSFNIPKEKIFKHNQYSYSKSKNITKKFSYIVAPNHDNYYGKNVINSVGALHNFKKKIPKNFEYKNKNIVSCLIGGENNHYLFGLKEAYNMCDKIKKLKKINSELEFLVISSRRTSKRN